MNQTGQILITHRCFYMDDVAVDEIPALHKNIVGNKLRVFLT